MKIGGVICASCRKSRNLRYYRYADIITFISLLLCITRCIPNHTLISASTRFGTYCCHLQEFQSTLILSPAHLQSDFISGAELL